MSSKKQITRIIVGFLTLLLALAITLPSQVVKAATIVVDTTVDDIIINGNCTLREAVIAANTDTAVDNCSAGSGSDTILLSAGFYTLSIPGTGEDAVATGDLDVSSDLTINGTGADTTIINAAGLDRVFDVFEDINLNVSGITITGGNVPGPGPSGLGGGIRNEGGVVTITNSTVSENTAGNGGIWNRDGTLIITDSWIFANTANYNGGGIYNSGGTVTLTNSTVSANVSGIHGGGICQFWGTVTINNSTVSENTAGNDGGGIFNVNPGSTVEIKNSTISGNSTSGNGGGISSSNDTTVTIINSAISSNSSNSAGGGIFNGDYGTVTLANSTISENSAADGGGIFTRSTMYITDTFVASNMANNNGGGIRMDGSDTVVTLTNSTVDSNTTDGNGGGIFSTGTLMLRMSTLYGNMALNGGGIYNFPGMSVLITNSTISGNIGEGYGGGISNSGNLMVDNSTISDNIANYSGGGISSEGDTVGLQNTIIAGNSTGYIGSDCSGEIDSLGYNIIGDTSDCQIILTPNDITNNNPLLGPLQDNGGTTWTHALLDSSPAIDAIPVSDCNVATDQRGVARPQGPACDIGAYEVESQGIRVTIDIYPNRYPNLVYPTITDPKDYRGLILVSVLTTPDFNARKVDPASVRFGTAGASAIQSRGVIKDVDRDGDADITFGFRIVYTGIKCGDTSASLSGATFDGQSFVGSDSIQTMDCTPPYPYP